MPGINLPPNMKAKYETACFSRLLLSALILMSGHMLYPFF
ncbi:Uncharacterized protein dnm_030240 [Desulfonema magnum]|uniref:Uncharacterized protein n=1 Tax=Desulfonema magnum TaxID=45655 RepID=A0A975GMR3_9BACT|nr:Uncharacterized protein dnm_030240 [Desulfonema magnum]